MNLPDFGEIGRAHLYTTITAARHKVVVVWAEGDAENLKRQNLKFYYPDKVMHAAWIGAGY